MRVFSITEAQLDELIGLNPEWPKEVERQQELADEIRKHVLVPVDQMREAFKQSYGSTQDDLQRSLLKQATSQPPAAE